MTDSAPQLQLLVDDLLFPEGPRWYDGSLWVSDIHSHCVRRYDESGASIARYTFVDRVSGLGHLPNGDGLVVSMLDRCLMRFGTGAPVVHADLTTTFAAAFSSMFSRRRWRILTSRIPGSSRAIVNRRMCLRRAST